MRSHEIRGKEVTSTDKAILFHRFGDRKPQWYPQQSIIRRRTTDRGTLVMEVHDWIYRRNVVGAEPNPEFCEKEPQKDIARDVIIKDDKILSEIPGAVRTCMEYMSSTELVRHFDDVIAELDDRGIDIDELYALQPK